ncbi:hypothetical protein GJ496_000770 [Pomphorhynchus laevis]|nr:hypothetical protein GJ496_000768 [Pomphorhynchus laevis]KAI0982583.1 hypothetical protein GJ496_000770 [Pomphorhynchus laevis]
MCVVYAHLSKLRIQFHLASFYNTSFVVIARLTDLKEEIDELRSRIDNSSLTNLTCGIAIVLQRMILVHLLVLYEEK